MENLSYFFINSFAWVLGNASDTLVSIINICFKVYLNIAIEIYPYKIIGNPHEPLAHAWK
jgi:hypothetical protein